jgi:hypothetical protein
MWFPVIIGSLFVFMILYRQKRWRQKATSPANKRIATAISVNPALILSIGREWGQSKFTFSEASAKAS